MQATPHSLCARVFTGLAVCLGLLTAALAVPTLGHARPLDLANRPLFTGSNVKPNILVAVDDSGSMDYETLFPTDDGRLYWDTARRSTWADGRFIRQSDIDYTYLFPNGFNRCDQDGCDHHDRRIYAKDYAIPPVPGMAFARSAQYNKAYFNPGVDYPPWVGDAFGDIDPTSAPADPSTGSFRFDLTANIKIDQSGYRFTVEQGMRIGGVTLAYPHCLEYEHHKRDRKGDRKGDHDDDRDDDDHDGDCKTEGVDWISVPAGTVSPKTGTVGIEYFPATFYLEAGTALPDVFGWRSGAEQTVGYTPDGRKNLIRYEIKPDNFISASAYQAAIQNFANWFSYYRKRNLAARGGIVGAFDRINQVRVGQCTINGRDRLQMRDLDDADQRGLFYDSIFNIDYAHGRGTPNRAALQFLGEQLKNNPNIITSPCQQNFAILFTDGYNSGGTSGDLGNIDGAYGPPFADIYGNTIADIAMKYYAKLGDIPDASIAREQLRLPADCENASPPLALDCQKDLHMVTFGVILGQQGIIFGNDDTEALQKQNADPYNHPPDWPNPQDSFGQEQIDDLWHATVNSRGKLLDAGTPKQVADKFTDALQKIINFTGSASAVATSSSTLKTDGLIYSAGFSSGIWTGSLEAYATTPRGIDTDAPVWRAADEIPAADRRHIVTSLGTGSDSRPAAFNYANLQATGALRDTISRAQVAYIRGDRSNERANGGDFRNRLHNILGDIVHSTPTYVGRPARSGYPDVWQDNRHKKQPAPESPYRAFARSRADRERMIYVGANDGMLHGFDAQTGAEKFAYIPHSVIPHLADLTRPDYAHRYYVDGSPATGDVFFAGAWHTVLVGGLGNGGRAIYALDITDPDNPDVLWEYTRTQDSRLGKTYGKPEIVRLHNGSWAAMFANGYNSDGQGASLFIVDIATGARIARVDVPGTANNDQANGLAAPFPADLDSDFITDYAYAGDLQGNLWRFDLTSKEPRNWRATRLFRAEDSDGAPQPITTRPVAARHPYGRRFGVMVYVGTGKYLENDDAALDTSKRNSLYGVWDTNVFTFNEAKNGEPLFTTSLKNDVPANRLVQQRIVAAGIRNGRVYRVVSDKPVAYQTVADKDVQPGQDKRGWQLVLPEDTGDRIVTNPRLLGRTLTFGTRIATAQSCTPGGSGFVMAVDAATGGRTHPAVIDFNGDHAFNAADTVALDGDPHAAISGLATAGAPSAATVQFDPADGTYRQYVSSSDGSVKPRTLRNTLATGRLSWREVRRRPD